MVFHNCNKTIFLKLVFLCRMFIKLIFLLYIFREKNEQIIISKLFKVKSRMEIFQGLIWIIIGFFGIINGLQCPQTKLYGRAPPTTCRGPIDPNLKPKSKIEKWFTKDMWDVNF